MSRTTILINSDASEDRIHRLVASLVKVLENDEVTDANTEALAGQVRSGDFQQVSKATARLDELGGMHSVAAFVGHHDDGVGSGDVDHERHLDRGV
jgi:hypothetical protein